MKKERIGTCAQCNEQFIPRPRGVIPKVCYACKENNRAGKCRTCGSQVPLVQRGGPRAGLVPSGYYCSDDCKPRCSIEGCDRPKRKRGWCGRHYALWNSYGDPEYEVKYRWASGDACIVCQAEELMPGSRQFCSTRGLGNWLTYRGEAPEAYQCAVCGIEVKYDKGHKRRRSDSRYCDVHARHARVSTTIEELAEFDGTDCGLCGKAIDMTLTGTTRGAPSIDHIKPRSLGGSDDRSNLQLAHFECNAGKRNHYIG